MGDMSGTPYVILIIPVIGALLTNVLLEIVKHRLAASRKKAESHAEKDLTLQVKEIEEASTIRRELWESAKDMSEKIEQLRSTLDEWKTKYFTLLGEHKILQAEYARLNGEIERLTRLNASLERCYEQLKEKVNTLHRG